MNYYSFTDSPIGKIYIFSNDDYLTGLYTENNKYFHSFDFSNLKYCKNKISNLTEKWLNSYFNLERPDIDIPIMLSGTEFRKSVWNELKKIPYGETKSYKDIAVSTAMNLNKSIMSCQAVGQAVSQNPISIIIPCHRVIGTDGSLTGYAGGIEVKQYLLELEKKKPQKPFDF